MTAYLCTPFTNQGCGYVQNQAITFTLCYEAGLQAAACAGTHYSEIIVEQK